MKVCSTVRETTKIDALVAEQRRLMALLKEKRQAVISHAVTRGLNPHAPLKPSGIEWLGDVPVQAKAAAPGSGVPVVAPGAEGALGAARAVVARLGGVDKQVVERLRRLQLRHGHVRPHTLRALHVLPRGLCRPPPLPRWVELPLCGRERPHALLPSHCPLRQPSHALPQRARRLDLELRS